MWCAFQKIFIRFIVRSPQIAEPLGKALVKLNEKNIANLISNVELSDHDKPSQDNNPGEVSIWKTVFDNFYANADKKMLNNIFRLVLKHWLKFFKKAINDHKLYLSDFIYTNFFYGVIYYFIISHIKICDLYLKISVKKIKTYSNYWVINETKQMSYLWIYLTMLFAIATSLEYRVDSKELIDKHKEGVQSLFESEVFFILRSQNTTNWETVFKIFLK